MRTVRLPADEGNRLIIWQHVTDVYFLAQGTDRRIVLTYKNGSTVKLQPHQARDLWFEVEEHRGCPPACFFRWECDGAPKDCMTCRLAEVLVGMDCEVRPRPIPPRRSRVFDARNVAIALLLLLVLLLVAALDAAPRPQEPRRDVLRQKRMK